MCDFRLMEAKARQKPPIPTFPRKRGKEQIAVARDSRMLPPPLAGEGWGGGSQAANAFDITQITPSMFISTS